MQMIFVLVLLLSGCVGTAIKAENGLIVRSAGETSLLRPSWSIGEVSKCVQDETGRYEEVDVDGETVGCYGRFLPIATVQGTQAGALTGLAGAMVTGGAIVGGAYLLGDGIRDSGDSTNLSNDSQSSSRAKAGARASSSSRSSAKQFQGQRQTQTNGMPMMGGD